MVFRQLRRFLTWLMFFITRISFPRFLVRAWIGLWMKIYNITLDDFTVPESGFKHFNQFHLRELKVGVRPVASGKIIFPCDGIVTAFGKISPNMNFQIKGNNYRLAELLGNTDTSFVDGNYVSIYLPVWSYHWWHAPLDAKLRKCVVHGGDYVTVAPSAQEKIPDLFVKNHRLVEYFYCDEKCAAILVGVAAFLVGTIVSTYPRNRDGMTSLDLSVKKGQKLGGFAFGSSVLLFLPSSFQLEPLQCGAFYRMGQALANQR